MNANHHDQSNTTIIIPRAQPQPQPNYGQSQPMYGQPMYGQPVQPAYYRGQQQPIIITN